MEQDHDKTEKKSYADGDGEIINGGTMNGNHKTNYIDENESKSLYSLICLTIGSILLTGDASSSLLERIRISFAENGPKLQKAFGQTAREIQLWTRGGSPLRALLVMTMGTIGLLTVMGLVVFMLFFVVATVNAIIISLLVSLAVAGGFLALFFFTLTGIYIGALSVASFVISTATVSAVVSVLVASGWIGFFYVVWLGIRGSFSLAKQSVSAVGSAVSGNGYSRKADGEVKIE